MSDLEIILLGYFNLIMLTIIIDKAEKHAENRQRVLQKTRPIGRKSRKNPYAVGRPINPRR
tara:strand:+ start:371 stop:553 length:183 start_codon:yes stop_codon:yes gene_type:complete